MSRLKVPAILSDIDGVIYRGKRAINNSAQAMRILMGQFSKQDQKFNLPFALLTNGGGVLERDRAKLVNQIVFGQDGDQDRTQFIQEDQMILCHTPIRSLSKSYKDKFVLLSGDGNVVEVANHYGFNKALHVDEYFALYPYHFSSLSRRCFPPERRQTALDRVKKRFGDSILDCDLQFEAVFIMSDPDFMEINLQLMTDLLMSKQGRISERRSKLDKQYVKLYCTNPDLMYADQFALPRMSGQQPLILALQSYIKHAFDQETQVTTFGKPNKTTFEYAKQIVDAQAAKMGVEISDYYMIGDNPPGDILGANLMGWKSILVRTGVYQGQVLPNEMKPQFEVNDMLDAAKLITNF